MYKKINLLEGHIIICGYGRNGKEAALMLQRSGYHYVVIEKGEHQEQASLDAAHHMLSGDATQDETLERAGIKRATALITTLPNDADNLFVVLTARELNANIHIISRASQDSSVRKLKNAGANNVIMPDKIGGAHMANLVINPDVKEFVDELSITSNDSFKILEFIVHRQTDLRELNAWQRTGATILGIRYPNKEYTMNPGPESKLSPDCRVIAMGSTVQLEQLSQLLNA